MPSPLTLLFPLLPLLLLLLPSDLVSQVLQPGGAVPEQGREEGTRGRNERKAREEGTGGRHGREEWEGGMGGNVVEWGE